MVTKAIAVTAVNQYRPDICALTFPNLRTYAARQDADFIVMTERKFPEWHPAYEKLQVFDVAAHYDYTLLIDADIALHPRLPSLFDSLNPRSAGCWQEYKIKDPTNLTLWETADDGYFVRDGRNLGIAGCLVGCSRYTRDIFRPLGPRHRPEDIQPKLYRPAIVDEYVMSRNIAKYGLQVAAMWMSKSGIYHADLTTKGEADAVAKLTAVLNEWGS
jgi:hypothetical protein